MRIPISPAHQIVRDLVEYLNDRVSEKRKIETIPYVLSHENNRVNVNGRSFTNKEKKSGCAVSLGFDVPEEFRHCSAQELLMEVLKPFVDLLHKDFDKGECFPLLCFPASSTRQSTLDFLSSFVAT